jgi:hypothetical protein
MRSAIIPAAAKRTRISYLTFEGPGGESETTMLEEEREGLWIITKILEYLKD